MIQNIQIINDVFDLFYIIMMYDEYNIDIVDTSIKKKLPTNISTLTSHTHTQYIGIVVTTVFKCIFHRKTTTTTTKIFPFLSLNLFFFRTFLSSVIIIISIIIAKCETRKKKLSFQIECLFMCLCVYLFCFV